MTAEEIGGRRAEDEDEEMGRRRGMIRRRWRRKWRKRNVKN